VVLVVTVVISIHELAASAACARFLHPAHELGASFPHITVLDPEQQDKQQSNLSDHTMGKKGTKGKQVQAPQAPVEHNYNTIPEIGHDDFYPRLHFAASVQIQAAKAAKKQEAGPSKKKPSVTSKGRDRGSRPTTDDEFCVAMAPFMGNRRAHDRVIPLSKQPDRTSLFGGNYSLKVMNAKAKSAGIEELFDLDGMQV
jgi:hypothetical protein